MGSTNSKYHPKNVELVKLKQKYDTERIRNAKLFTVWVIGGNTAKTRQLAEMISNRRNYMLVTEDLVLEKEMASGSPRTDIIREILGEKGVVGPGIILDLVVEVILDRVDGTQGIVFHGLPRDKRQALHLQRSIGTANLVIYCELKGKPLREALTSEGESPSEIKTKVAQFDKSVLQLSKHKNTFTVDGDGDPQDVVELCLDRISAMAAEA